MRIALPLVLIFMLVGCGNLNSIYSKVIKIVGDKGHLPVAEIKIDWQGKQHNNFRYAGNQPHKTIVVRVSNHSNTKRINAQQIHTSLIGKLTNQGYILVEQMSLADQTVSVKIIRIEEETFTKLNTDNSISSIFSSTPDAADQYAKGQSNHKQFRIFVDVRVLKKKPIVQANSLDPTTNFTIYTDSFIASITRTHLSKREAVDALIYPIIKTITNTLL